MNQTKQIEFKISETCNTVNETSKLKTYYKECKQCINKKDATDWIRRNKMYYQKHKEYFINRYLNYYYKIKDVNSEGVECALISCCFEWFLAYKYLITLYTFNRIIIMSF